MAGYWISFGIFIFLVILGIIKLKLPVLLGIRYTFYCSILSLFIIFIAYKNLICQFVFGGLYLIMCFTNLSINYVQSDKGKLIKRIELILDFVLATGTLIYLIYIIPNQNLQNIVIPIIAAVYGGLLTLVGVALTIRKSDKDRKEDEIKKAKPLVFVIDKGSRSSLENQIERKWLFSEKGYGDLEKANDDEDSFSLYHIPLSNSDYSYCSVIGFKINEKVHFYDYGQVLPKNSSIDMFSRFEFKFDEKIEHVAILLEDMLDNIYEFVVETEIVENKKEKIIKILSGLKTKKSDLIFEKKEN